MGSRSSTHRREAPACCPCLVGVSRSCCSSRAPACGDGGGRGGARPADEAGKPEGAASGLGGSIGEGLAASHPSSASTAAPACDAGGRKEAESSSPASAAPAPAAAASAPAPAPVVDDFDPDAAPLPPRSLDAGPGAPAPAAGSPWPAAVAEAAAASEDQPGGFADFSSAPPAPPAVQHSSVPAAERGRAPDGDKAVKAQQPGPQKPAEKNRLAGPPGELGHFSVEVPEPYPGVQYRATKCLDDRLPRFAVRGDVVAGYVEEDGNWIRTEAGAYLPTKVSEMHVLVPSAAAATPPVAAGPTRASGGGGLLACCSGAHDRGQYAELLLDEE